MSCDIPGKCPNCGSHTWCQSKIDADNARAITVTCSLLAIIAAETILLILFAFVRH